MLPQRNSAQVIIACSAIIERRSTHNDDLAAAFKERGAAYDEIGRHAAALNDFDRAIAIKPDDWDAYNGRGMAKTALKSYALAVEDFNQAIRGNPTRHVAYSNRCFAKAMLGDLNGALLDCNECIRLSPDSPSGFASRALVHFFLKQYDSAITDYDTALSIRSEDPSSLFGRGAAKYKKGDLKGGDGDIVWAQALKPNIADDMASIGIRPGNLSLPRRQSQSP